MRAGRNNFHLLTLLQGALLGEKLSESRAEIGEVSLAVET